MTIQDLYDNRDFIPLWILARYTYRVGDPFLSDAQYESLTALIKKNEQAAKMLKDYLNRTYDEDPIPYKLLEMVGMEPVVINDTDIDPNLIAALDEDKSMSCDSVTDYDSAFVFFTNYRNLKKDLMVSLKVDGINTKTLYTDGKLALSLSRGRHAKESFNFTNNTKLILPRSVEGCITEMKVIGDSYVDLDGIKLLRNEIDEGKYKTAKSSAISLLRVRHDLKYYKHLHTCVFAAEGIADTLEETFNLLEGYGFEVTPHRLIKYTEIPTDYEEFKVWLKDTVFDYIYDNSIGIPSDGIVVEVNDMHFEGELYGQYSTRQLALKFEQWSFKYYKGIVEDIVWEQKRVHASLRIRIEPIETVDGCKAQWIAVYSPSIMISNDIYKGQTVLFERNSGAVNILIHGKRLEGIISEE